MVAATEHDFILSQADIAKLLNYKYISDVSKAIKSGRLNPDYRLLTGQRRPLMSWEAFKRDVLADPALRARFREAVGCDIEHWHPVDLEETGQDA